MAYTFPLDCWKHFFLTRNNFSLENIAVGRWTEDEIQTKMAQLNIKRAPRDYFEDESGILSQSPLAQSEYSNPMISPLSSTVSLLPTLRTLRSRDGLVSRFLPHAPLTFHLPPGVSQICGEHQCIERAAHGTSSPNGPGMFKFSFTGAHSTVVAPNRKHSARSGKNPSRTRNAAGLGRCGFGGGRADPAGAVDTRHYGTHAIFLSNQKCNHVLELLP